MIEWHNAGRDDWLSVAKPDLSFMLKFNSRAEKLYKNFEEAADYNAQLLYEDWGDKPLFVSLSGGLDSELCARILLKNKIPFTPIILNLADTNKDESWFAEYWCYKNNVTPIKINFSIDDIRSKLFIPYLPEMHKMSYQFGTLINLFVADYAEHQGGHSISGVGDINFDFESQQFYCDYIDFTVDLHRPKKHPTGFFMYTPEIALSYIHQFDLTLGEQYNKLNFYNVGARTKTDYLPNFRVVNPACTIILEQRAKYIPGKPQPHWYGSKQNLIDILQPL
jgi:NH3-dependent NAD+ synthetase